MRGRGGVDVQCTGNSVEFPMSHRTNVPEEKDNIRFWSVLMLSVKYIESRRIFCVRMPLGYLQSWFADVDVMESVSNILCPTQYLCPEVN